MLGAQGAGSAQGEGSRQRSGVWEPVVLRGQGPVVRGVQGAGSARGREPVELRGREPVVLMGQGLVVLRPVMLMDVGPGCFVFGGILVSIVVREGDSSSEVRAGA